MQFLVFDRTTLIELSKTSMEPFAEGNLAYKPPNFYILTFKYSYNLDQFRSLLMSVDEMSSRKISSSKPMKRSDTCGGISTDPRSIKLDLIFLPKTKKLML